ncbi:MAG: alginate export family protein [Pseudomonadota bacterium]
MVGILISRTNFHYGSKKILFFPNEKNIEIYGDEMVVQLAKPVCCVLAFSLIEASQVSMAQTDQNFTNFSIDVRSRWETASTDALPEQADAWTIRMRPSLELKPAKNISIIAEIEAIGALLSDERNGLFSDGLKPAIPDTEGIELNRAQILWAMNDNWSFNLGRQHISLDDERFIGISDFRQNQQTYDAITSSFTHPGGASLDVGYIWQVNRFVGSRQPNGRQNSDSLFFNASIPTPVGQATLFHYSFSLDRRDDHRSNTTGFRYAGRHFWNQEFGLYWQLGAAKQAVADSDPMYALGAIEFEWRDLTLSGRYERLGSDDGRAFQTPLGTLHKFQGAADVFTVTPDDGLQDTQLGVTWRLGSFGKLRATSLNATYNVFRSTRQETDFGEEFGLTLGSSLGGTRLGIAATTYRASNFGTDTSKAWLTFSRRF